MKAKIRTFSGQERIKHIQMCVIRKFWQFFREEECGPRGKFQFLQR